MKAPLIVFLLSALFMILLYPIDGFERTGIRRLLRLERIQKGEIQSNGAALPAGALSSYEDIRLNLPSRAGDSLGGLLVADPEFQQEVNGLFRGLDRSYSIALLDISDPDHLRYAQRNALSGYQPGSVGKIAVLNGLFHQLALLYPDSWEKRTELLRTRSVKAGVWGLTDEHTIPIYNPEDNRFVKRRVIASDVFTLYEWTDHMLSVSNNGAASIVWREVMLMAAFGQAYPELTEADAEAYFKETPRSELTDLGNRVVNEPLRDLGISHEEWRLGSFFTRGANTYVGDKGGSTGTPLGLMKFLIRMEQGNIVDPESSLEMKRLLYMTDRRIRYAQAPSLRDAAVYFKSGSLYKCDRVKNPDCGQYQGNVINYMNSVAIVEHPDNCRYMVVLMTNVLGKNSATDHMYLAGRVDKLVRKN